MSSPFVAEIRMFAGNFAPTGWAGCDGQLLPISQNTALFSLLGTTYGGDGRSTFALPNLEGSAAIGQGQGSGLSDRFLGEISGAQSITLLNTEMASHNHGLGGQDVAGDQFIPTSSLEFAGTPDLKNLYKLPPATGVMHAQTLTITGSSLPHNNMQPYLCVFFMIALQGVYPPRS